MSKERKIVIGVVTAILTLITGAALALANISLVSGSTVEAYDFGTVTPSGESPIEIGVQPATIQIQEFTLKPGDTIPWHYHDGTSYIVLERGTVTEWRLNPDGTCMRPRVLRGPGAFWETPGEVHTVKNTGRRAAVISWTTLYPTEKGVMHFAPQFESGGLYPVSPAPDCQ